jgi:hypothetical protein
MPAPSIVERRAADALDGLIVDARNGKAAKRQQASEIRNAVLTEMNKEEKRKQRRGLGPTGPQSAKQMALVGMRKASGALLRQIPKNSTAHDVAVAFALPLGSRAPRVGSPFDVAPTSVATPYYLRPCNFSTVNSISGGGQLKDGAMLLALSRNPLRSLIQYSVNPFATVNVVTAPYVGCYVGTLYFSGTVTAGTPTGSQTVSTAYSFASSVGFNTELPLVYMQDAYWGDTAHYHPHGYHVYAGAHLGKKGIWIDATSTQSARIYLTSTNAQYWMLFRLAGDQWESYAQSGSGTTATPTFTIVDSGYYAISFGEGAIGNGSVTGIVCVSSSSFGHFALPYFEARETTTPGIRTTAASLMWSNAASNLNAEGVAAGVQLKPGQSWTSVINVTLGDPVAAVLNNTGGEGASEFPLKRGIYGFHKPPNSKAFEMFDPSISNQYGVVDICFDLVDPTGWLVVAMSTALVSGSYPGGDGYVTAVWDVEFMSPDPWYAALPPPDDSETVEAAVKMIRNLPQWHENPLHLKQIGAFLKSAGRTALRLSPVFFKFLRQLNPQYSGVFGPLGAASAALGALV